MSIVKRVMLGINHGLHFENDGHLCESGTSEWWCRDTDPKDPAVIAFLAIPRKSIVSKLLEFLPPDGFILGSMMRGKSCKFCGCRNGKSCRAGCWWVNADPPCCSTAACVAKLAAEQTETTGRLL